MIAAVPDVRAIAHLITQARGGGGAVRECLELILCARGVRKAVVADFVEAHGGTADRAGMRRASSSPRARS